MALAFWGVDLLLGPLPEHRSRTSPSRAWTQIHVDAPVLAFALGALAGDRDRSSASPPLCSLARRALGEALRESGRGTTEGREHRNASASALVVGEVALALVLTTGAALMVRSFAAPARRATWASSRRGSTTARVLLPRAEPASPGRVQVRHAREEARVLRPRARSRCARYRAWRRRGPRPTCRSAGWSGTRGFEVEGRPPPRPPRSRHAECRRASTRTTSAPCGSRCGRAACSRPTTARAPRPWSSSTRRSRAATARARTRSAGASAGAVGTPGEPSVRREVVGVVGDVRHHGLAEPGRARALPALSRRRRPRW